MLFIFIDNMLQKNIKAFNTEESNNIMEMRKGRKKIDKRLSSLTDNSKPDVLTSVVGFELFLYFSKINSILLLLKPRTHAHIHTLLAFGWSNISRVYTGHE